MKRAREDGTGAPGVKRVNQAQRAAPVPAQGGRLTTTDALNYLRCVHDLGPSSCGTA
jgi:hypothetical protein